MSRAAADQDVFRAIADPSRRTILLALAERPHTFQELHALVPVTKGTVSAHLSILVAVGLATVSVVDRRHHYALGFEPLLEVDDWLALFRHHWTRYLDGLSESMRRAAASRPARRPPPSA